MQYCASVGHVWIGALGLKEAHAKGKQNMVHLVH